MLVLRIRIENLNFNLNRSPSLYGYSLIIHFTYSRPLSVSLNLLNKIFTKTNTHCKFFLAHADTRGRCVLQLKLMWTSAWAWGAMCWGFKSSLATFCSSSGRGITLIEDYEQELMYLLCHHKQCWCTYLKALSSFWVTLYFKVECKHTTLESHCWAIACIQLYC